MENIQVKTAVKALDSKKGKEIKVLRVGDITVLTDYFVICTGTSSTQVKALADECEYQLSRAGFEPRHREGTEGRSWSLLDYGYMIVHVYNQEAREFYNLERFWADAEEIDIQNVMDEKENNE